MTLLFTLWFFLQLLAVTFFALAYLVGFVRMLYVSVAEWLDASVNEESGWQSHYLPSHAGSNPVAHTILAVKLVNHARGTASVSMVTPLRHNQSNEAIGCGGQPLITDGAAILNCCGGWRKLVPAFWGNVTPNPFQMRRAPERTEETCANPSPGCQASDRPKAGAANRDTFHVTHNQKEP